MPLRPSDDGEAIGEISPQYLNSATAAARIHGDLPDGWWCLFAIRPSAPGPTTSVACASFGSGVRSRRQSSREAELKRVTSPLSCVATSPHVAQMLCDHQVTRSGPGLRARLEGSQQVLTVRALLQALGLAADVVGRHESEEIGDLLGTGDLQPLPQLHLLDEIRGAEERLLRARAEPGVAAAEHPDVQASLPPVTT